MKPVAIAAAVLALSAAAVVPAAAQTAFYGNLNYSLIDAQDADVTLGALGGRVGARFNPYLGVEAEAAFGVKDDDVRVGNVPVKVELEHTVGAYLVGFVPVQPNFDLFARIGYVNSKVKASALGASAKADGSSWNAGVGGQYFFTANDGVRAEYTKSDLNNDDGLDANIWSVGYVRKF